MSSSREVTAQKKKDVWEEAGGEFYQESYPSGSKPENHKTHRRRPSRLGIPLPSHTARRGSLLQGRINNKTGGRRKPFGNNTGARTGLTYTSTMATPMDANGTTTNVNDIQVAILPDLSEETIQNERKTWEELLRIKSLPIPMAQKKQLKSQITSLPKLRLKGYSHLKYSIRKAWNHLQVKISHTKRHMVFLNSSIRTVEIRRGTAIANVFLFIKWTMLLNLVMSIAMLSLVIGPYVTFDIMQGGRKTSNADVQECRDTYNGLSILNLSYPEAKKHFLGCCEAEYDQKRNIKEEGIHGIMTQISKWAGLGDFETWPTQYSYYHESLIHFGENGTMQYPFAVVYVFTGCLIMCFCLIQLIYNISDGVREIIKLKEGAFFKYSNLVFSGWDHFTVDEQGAEFKRNMIRCEMKASLHTEKKKITDLGVSRKESLKLLLIRIFVNAIVVAMLASAGWIIFYVSLHFTKRRHIYHERSQELRLNLTNATLDGLRINSVVEDFIPSFIISFFNLIFPLVLARLGKYENYSKEWEIGLVLIRSLIVRLCSIYAAARVFYIYQYCNTVEGTCYICATNGTEDTIDEDTDKPIQREACWEGDLAGEVYKLVLTELAIKTVLTFVGDPLRRLCKYCCNNKVGKRIGTLNFNIVRHSLDIIYIQILAWISFHFAPFMPIVTMLYCYVIFYIKKFGVIHNVNYVPDTFRTTRTTAVFLGAKVISFVAVLFTYAFIVGRMVPSTDCGPFRGYLSAWSVVTEEFKHTPHLYMILDFVFPSVAIPVVLILMLVTYYYYSVAQANRAMVETLRHLLVLEGHDKQYLFSKLNSLRRKSQSNSPTTDDGATLNQP